MSQVAELDVGTAFIMRRIDRQRSARAEQLLQVNYGSGRGLKEDARSLVEDLRSMCRIRGISWDEVVALSPASQELERQPKHPMLISAD